MAAFYGLQGTFGAGTVERLLAESAAAGISKTVVHSVATAKEQVHSINRFLGSWTGNAALHPFGTLHPDMEAGELREEMAHVLEEGLHGIKLHPDCQRFAADGKRGRRMMDAVAEAAPGFVVLLHAGDPRFDCSHPRQIAALAKDYPELTFLAAHFGGWNEWDGVGVYEGLQNVYFDTSSTLPYLARDKAEALIRRFGADRFLFATDYPMWDTSEELARFNTLDLTDSDRRAILSENARRVLGV